MEPLQGPVICDLSRDLSLELFSYSPFNSETLLDGGVSCLTGEKFATHI